ncbi:ABC transporter ATP-binding protein/permease [Clostridium sp. MSJ-4]|uniref:ABC transporter ATP-binding protein/permease n=1 Tax=Clostridium simiarum TaxID=2841506 RepID=A0ABS6EZ69_9CLOT|nr:ABC transporter ATP-binding protein/permease [Clostridium simiarum]
MNVIIILKDKKVTKQILNIFKPYNKKLMLIIFTMILGTIISMFTPLIAKKIMDEGLINKHIYTVIKYSLIALTIVIFQQFIELIQTKYLLNINSKIKYRLNSKCMSKLFKVKMSYYDENNVTEIMKNISMDVENLSKLSDRCTLLIITEVLKFVGGLIGLLLIDYKLTLCVIIFIPLKYKATSILSKKKEKLFQNYMEYNSDYYSWFGNTVSGIREIKLWNVYDVKKKEFTKKQRKLIKTDVKFGYLDKINDMCEMSLVQGLTTLLYVLGAYMVIGDELSIGSLFAFLTYSTYVTNPISIILNVGYSFSTVYPSAKRLFDFLNMEDEQRNNKIKHNEINGDLELKDVSFAYNEEKIVLKNINLKIDKGEKVILLGNNGSGKSTLIKLILGLYEPTEGNIYMNDLNIKDIKFKDYRNIFSVVNQDSYIFDGSVKDNISLFSNKNIKHIKDICKKSGASEFIDKLPGKYEAILGKRGVKLSGGQVQRLAIARAMAKDFDVLIFDEATSNCDFKTQLYMSNLVKEYFRDKTLIMITHKIDIDLLKSMDKIIIMNNGSIDCVGSHYDLLNKNEFYKELVNKYYLSLGKKVI